MSEAVGREGRERVLKRLREADRFVLVTHENPDGDALGSLVGMHGLLRSLGKDAVMFMAAREFPLSHEYRFFALEGQVRTDAAGLGDRIAVFLDCGNLDRNPAEALYGAPELINIDHHHDNTLFGTVNLVAPEASCTAEIVWELMNDLGVRPDAEVAEALYVGLVTDTGRFMYENTSARAHVMAAELIDAGVDVQGVYRRLYEGLPYAKLHLLALALARVQRYDDGLLALTEVTESDYEQTGAEESYTEGIVDHLRAVEGTRVAGLVRAVTAPDRRGARKVSLRSVDGHVDVSAIARAQGGGGHRQAAGFTTELANGELVAFLRAQVSSQVSDGPHPAPEAAGAGSP